MAQNVGNLEQGFGNCPPDVTHSNISYICIKGGDQANDSFYGNSFLVSRQLLYLKGMGVDICFKVEMSSKVLRSASGFIVEVDPLNCELFHQVTHNHQGCHRLNKQLSLIYIDIKF